MISKGSEWRRWDLHFHTPSSYDYDDKSVTNQDIIDGLGKNSIKAVAITDHHVIDIDRIRELRKIANDEIVIFPGVELRSELGGSESVHFICIFPEDIDLEMLQMKFCGKLNLTKEDISKCGDDKVYTSLLEASKITSELGGILTIHAGAKTNTVENITNKLSYKMAIKKDIVDVVDIYEVGKIKDIEEYEKNVFPNIDNPPATIICSDNHNIKKYKLKEKLWIKSELSFEGLKQAIRESEGRIFIGDLPEVMERLKNDSTKFIDTLKISKVKDSKLDGVWFDDIEIKLNPELVAIIGNKGNGKSAFADIIGLLGDTKNYKYFNFLNKEKFRNNDTAKHFNGEIIWGNGTNHKRNLMENPKIDSIERVKYIPQNYLEIICNDIDNENSLERELKSVIYSHIDRGNKAGKNNLDEILEEKNRVTYKIVSDLRNEISVINNEIIKLEKLNQEDVLKKFKNAYSIKMEELKAHLGNKPDEIKKPEQDATIVEKQKETLKQINLHKENLNNLQKDIENEEQQKGILNTEITSLENFQKEMKLIVSKFEQFKSDSLELFIKYNIVEDDLIKLEVNTSIVTKILEEKRDKLSILNNDNEDSKVFKKEVIEKQIADLLVTLDTPSQDYHKYLNKITQWEDKLKRINGSKKEPDTIEYYKHIISYIEDELESVLNEKIDIRFGITSKIFKCMTEIVGEYKTLYKPLTHFIDSYHEKLSENYPITFDANIELKSSFEETFLEYINQGVKGTFYGKFDGEAILKEYMSSYKDDSFESLREALSQINYSLQVDQRTNEKRNPEVQIKRDSYLEFYNYLFGLSYLEPIYKLKLDGKELSQLSPGEKGALLLIFYLILDKSDTPLVIDQPEENLDNQSVYNILVPFIKEAKSRRQVIIVTHNPNLAVVCDSEQIINISIDKTNKNTISILSGAIESIDINRAIVEILEGTLPAFENRARKYEVTKKNHNIKDVK